MVDLHLRVVAREVLRVKGAFKRTSPVSSKARPPIPPVGIQLLAVHLGRVRPFTIMANIRNVNSEILHTMPVSIIRSTLHGGGYFGGQGPIASTDIPCGRKRVQGGHVGRGMHCSAVFRCGQ